MRWRNRFRVQVAGFEGHFMGFVGGGRKKVSGRMSGRFCPGDFGAGDQTEEIVTVLLLVRRDNGDGDGDCC